MKLVTEECNKHNNDYQQAYNNVFKFLGFTFNKPGQDLSINILVIDHDQWAKLCHVIDSNVFSYLH